MKWATCNLGAVSPEEYGDYYAWGETEPYYEDGYAQEDPQKHWKDGKTEGYWWSSYKYGSDFRQLTKYCTDSRCGYNGFTDGKTVLDTEDDVASVELGGAWRMPTIEEFKELLNNCTWTWTTQNGVVGYKVTSNVSGYTDRSIFLPAAGWRYGTSLIRAGEYGGYYWSSSLSTDGPNYARSLLFDSGSLSTNSDYRSGGRFVRPV